MLSPDLKRKIQESAIKAYPNELCGFVVHDEFYQVPNVHLDPTQSFEVKQEVWREFSPNSSLFVHSHPDWYACPSERDMRQQAATAMPWGIVATNGQAATDIAVFGDGSAVPDLLRRSFVHGVTDCYDAIRDWYKIERNVSLLNFPRSWEWWLKDGESGNLYKDNFEKAGFYKLPYDNNFLDPKEGDVFLASIGKSGKLNHGGVYIGNGLGYHHLTAQKPVDPTRLAKKDPIHRWSKYIRIWLRYRDG